MRAEKTAARMGKCHSAAWESCSQTDESVALLWCNPLYDDDRHGDEKRLALVRGEALALVIPKRCLERRILRLAEIAIAADAVALAAAAEISPHRRPVGRAMLPPA